MNNKIVYKVMTEKEMAKNARFSYFYALDVLKKRFELGEKAIAQDAKYSYWYARNVIKGRFKLGEEAIAKDFLYSYYYVVNVILPYLNKETIFL